MNPFHYTVEENYDKTGQRPWTPRAFFYRLDDAEVAAVNWQGNGDRATRVLNWRGQQWRRYWRDDEGACWMEDETGKRICMGQPVLIV